MASRNWTAAHKLAVVTEVLDRAGLDGESTVSELLDYLRDQVVDEATGRYDRALPVEASNPILKDARRKQGGEPEQA